MANACFRCGSSLASGRTFCGQCRSAVSLADASSESTPRWWKLVTFGAVGFTVSTALGIAGVSVWEALGPFVIGIVGALVVLSYFLGLYLDERALQSRADLEWDRSDWYVTTLLFVSVFMVTIPFVCAVYLYQRRASVGLE